MSKVYEAMQEARRDRKLPKTEVEVSLPTRWVPEEILFESEMLGLYRSLDNIFPGLNQKVLMFLGAKGGEGVSTVVKCLARVAAERFNRNIVILDANTQCPTQHKRFGIDRTVGWSDVLKGTAVTEQSIYPTHDKRISVVPASSVCRETNNIIDVSGMSDIFEALRKRFDLVLVDCAPAGECPDSITLGRQADGVVLVLEAESTRSPVVETIIQQVTMVGGRVIGAVLNKRRYYIPSFIYSRL